MRWASTPAGSVRLRVSRCCDPDGVQIEVEDTGIGIPEERVDEIFDAFRQIDQAYTREFGGTGLGLSITAKLLELLQGRITVRSKVGDGSCFTIQLPQLDGVAPAVVAGDAVRETSRGS
jgi:signal transduction histidine kinase